MKLSTRTFESGMHYITKLPLSFLSNMGDGKTPACTDGPAWTGKRDGPADALCIFNCNIQQS